mmetsp:Transcript_115089/g.320627  ORF Transcript_115089/g.320627 Transcript_115089/m.320627 type:complete len:261 (-) Transcript_115089:147-929(-)
MRLEGHIASACELFGDRILQEGDSFWVAKAVQPLMELLLCVVLEWQVTKIYLAVIGSRVTGCQLYLVNIQKEWRALLRLHNHLWVICLVPSHIGSTTVSWCTVRPRVDLDFLLLVPENAAREGVVADLILNLHPIERLHGYVCSVVFGEGYNEPASTISPGTVDAAILATELLDVLRAPLRWQLTDADTLGCLSCCLRLCRWGARCSRHRNCCGSFTLLGRMPGNGCTLRSLGASVHWRVSCIRGSAVIGSPPCQRLAVL